MVSCLDFESKKASAMAIAKRKIVLGVGVNDCDHVVNITVDGKNKFYKPYSDWLNMIKRCYCPSFHIKRPKYKFVTVCDDWLKFSSFRDWHKKNYTEGYSLDKDILTDLSVYSPESCIYVPCYVNNFIEDSGGSRGKFPIGVSLTKSGTYHSYCRNPFNKKRINIGYFNNKEDARLARLEYKLMMALDYKEELDAIDERLYERIVLIIKRQK